MTEQEKMEIAEIVKQQLMAEHGMQLSENNKRVLDKTLNKYFRGEDCYKSPMYKAFGSIKYYQVWENIRRLTCLICGKSYVRELKDSQEANEIADKLCELVLKLREEHKE